MDIKSTPKSDLQIERLKTKGLPRLCLEFSFVSNKRSHNRVRYTKMVLQEAILKILQDKPIDKVTIKEICDEAEINKGTFYLHYTTPYDLLKETENKFIEDNMVCFSAYMQNEYERSRLDRLGHYCHLAIKEIS